MSRIFDDLNESQKKAVMAVEGPVLIVAGPGTGKTFTIVRRIAHLIERGIKPENILAVTFTNRAAQEMRERTEFLLGRDVRKVFIGTFHLLGLRIIRDSYQKSFVIYNRQDQINLLKKLIRDSGAGEIPQNKKSPWLIAEKISRIKNFIEDMDEGIKEVYEEYNIALTENSSLDFDDLILRPIEILNDSKMSEKYGETFQYIMVDEYQDINPSQYKLLTLLAKTRGNLCAIGDSDQAIYAFRGADVSNFLNFERDFEDARMISLTENYRSTGVILNASSSLIKNNTRRIDKEVRPVREKGIPITVISVPDEKAEGEIIVREIEERIGGTSHYQISTRRTHSALCSYSFSDFAVIYRTNAQAKAIEGCLIESGIPYQVIGEKYLLKRRGIMNILSLLKAIINPACELHPKVLSTIKEGSDMSPERFRNLKDKIPFDEFLKVLWKESGIKDLLSEEDFLLLEDIVIRYRDMEPEETLDRFINELSLLTPADAFDSEADAVALMTLHMAKGLEFKVVFIAGLENGLIPYTRKEDVDIEEERRLFYVGITRAKDELFLLHARKRFLHGQRLTQSESPLLREIPGEFIKTRFIPDKIKKGKKERQTGLF
ncbi:MAG: UvrD-helicase domain-containing protein [Nitrospirota bacterium]